MGIIPRYQQTTIRQGADPNAQAIAAQPFEMASQAIGMAQQYKQAKDASFVNSKAAQLQKNVDDYFERAKTDFQANPDNGLPAMQKFMQTSFKELSSDGSQEAIAALGQIKQQIQNDYESKWNTYSRTQNIKNFTVELDNSAQNIALTARNAGKRGEDLNPYLNQIDMSVLAGSTFLGETDLKVIKQDARKKITQEYLEGLGDRDPYALKGKLNEGVEGLDVDTIQSLEGFAERQIKSREAEAKRAQAEKTQRLSQQLDFMIYKSSNINNEQSITQDELEEGLKSGDLSIPLYLQKAKALDAALKTRFDKQKEHEAYNYLSEGGIFNPSNKDHKKAMDTFYDGSVAPMLNDLEINEQLDQKVNFAVKNSAIPTALKQEVTGALYAGDNNSKVMAANVMSDMVIKNPSLARQFRNEDIAYSMKIQSAVNAGLNEQQAVEFAQSQTFLAGTPEYKSRNDVFNKESADFKNSEVNRRWFGNPEQVPPEMKTEWKSLYRYASVVQGLDDDQAQKFAYANLNSTWGVSEISGKAQWKKYAPEVMYNIEGASSDWMNEQLKGYLGTDDLSDVDVIPDIRTVRSGEPVYQVIRKTMDNGNIFLDTLRNESGETVYWKPEYTETQEYADKVKEFEEQSSKDKEEFEKQRQRNLEKIDKYGEIVPKHRLIKGAEGREVRVKSQKFGL